MKRKPPAMRANPPRPMARTQWLSMLLITAAAGIFLGRPNAQGQISPHANHGPSQAPMTAELRQRAEAGESEAQFQLAYHYRENEPRNYAEALKWFRKAAEQGHSQAQVFVGEFYREGNGDLAKNPQQAVEWFRKAADQGNPSGQVELALMYETGEGVPPDNVQAVRWYTRAADQGLDIAQFDLAYMYENGKGVAADSEKAVRLYEMAALSVPMARTNLAVLYGQGRGPVRKDQVTSYKWALLAVSAEFQRILHQKDVGAEPLLGHAIILAEQIAQSMNESQKKAGRQLAEEWINSNASHLGGELRTFADATKDLK